jgi:hypothetical protein
MAPKNSTELLDKHLSKKKTEFIKFVVSPGSAGSFLDAPSMVAPTGEKCLVMREMRMKQVVEVPDADNRIIMLNTPFFEAPLIRINTAGNQITSWKAYQLPGYEMPNSTSDPLKDNEIFAWRMIANSLTGIMDAAPIDAAGSCTVASLPLSLDKKMVYDVSSTATAPALPVAYARSLDYLPLSTNEISAITNQFVTHKAVEGSYNVLRHTDPNLPFTYRDSESNKATFNIYRYDSNGHLDSFNPAKVGVNILEFSNSSFPGVACYSESNNPVGVTMPSCMNLGMTIYSGLKANTPITFKLVAAWEFVPKMNSSKISQCRSMRPKDTLFLEMLNTAELTAKSLGVAKDNGLGTFLKGLLNGITKAVPMVKELSAALPLPPVVKTIVGQVADTIPKINAIVNKETKDNAKAQSKAVTVKRATVPKRQ